MRQLLVLMITLCTLASPSFADNKSINTPLTKSTNIFDVKDANQAFDRLNLKLSTHFEQSTLKGGVKTLKDLLGNAEECIRVNEKKLGSIDGQIKEASQTNQPSEATEKINESINTSKSTADLVYLTKERKTVTEKLSQCRLFTIRAKEALEVYESTLSRIQKEQILERGEPFWINAATIFNQDLKLTNIPITTLNIPPQITKPRNLYVIFATSFLMAAIIFYKSFHSKIIRRYIRIKKIYMHSFVLLTLGISSLLITCYLIFLYYHFFTVSNFLLWLSSALTIFLLGLFAIIVFFNLKKVKAFLCWYSLDTAFFKLLTMFIFTLYGISKTSKVLAKEFNVSPLLWKVEQSLFLYIELFMAIAFIFYFCHAHRQIKFIKKHKIFVKLVPSLMFISFAVINLIGYNSLSMHLSISGVATFAIIFGTIMLVQSIGKTYNLCLIDSSVQKKITYLFGYRPGQTLTEILILKTTLQIVVVISSVYLISKRWGYASSSIENIYNYIVNGIKFETFTFHPTRIIFGIIVFCVLYLIFRSISTAISRHEQFDGEEETQVAIASIFTYVGFTIAIIAALLIAGFDFTGLAIVAGALSVGIGLGLQSIVNNFVSGIILLIEKPIKPGDRISVDGIEGFVKKVRVRSTQILTTTREDMIIPNSDLITHRVTNFMYSDKHLTIFCEMGIDYGSDIELAKEILIEIATRHPEVITTVKNNKPRVFIRSFGENSMLFQVWFLIRDGNRKVAIRSEIYFEIIKAFKANNIAIAFPQRDVHINLKDIETTKKLN